ncbi:hypothetical protein XENOCAPTIV_016627 [Xenoophorus captivus]|uniref:Uncharacterized protein n=1 Tax=Xenoophorus captivus TaxID=1517983 RepID=A0ABV0QIL4_9TELE
MYFGLQGDVGLPGPSGSPGDGSLSAEKVVTIYKGDKSLPSATPILFCDSPWSPSSIKHTIQKRCFPVFTRHHRMIRTLAVRARKQHLSSMITPCRAKWACLALRGLWLFPKETKDCRFVESGSLPEHKFIPQHSDTRRKQKPVWIN